MLYSEARAVQNVAFNTKSESLFVNIIAMSHINMIFGTSRHSRHSKIYKY